MLREGTLILDRDAPTSAAIGVPNQAFIVGEHGFQRWPVVQLSAEVYPAMAPIATAHRLVEARFFGKGSSLGALAMYFLQDMSEVLRPASPHIDQSPRAPLQTPTTMPAPNTSGPANKDSCRRPWFVVVLSRTAPWLRIATMSAMYERTRS